jgi:hypothetical protein
MAEQLPRGLFSGHDIQNAGFFFRAIHFFGTNIQHLIHNGNALIQCHAHQGFRSRAQTESVKVLNLTMVILYFYKPNHSAA